jgi:hypothetical protein
MRRGEPRNFVVWTPSAATISLSCVFDNPINVCDADNYMAARFENAAVALAT